MMEIAIENKAEYVLVLRIKDDIYDIWESTKKKVAKFA